ncbi:MAG: ParA family protein [Spirochaetaceae bacterium]|nr:MAG: ParA family protein [Spirochaetaceae bacterium]
MSGGVSRRLVFTNRKGGCGKTTTSVNVAAALAHMGSNVLVIDTDPQAHATMSLGIAQGGLVHDLSTVAEGRSTAEAAIRSSYVPRLNVIPATRRLADFERRYANTMEARFWFRDRLGPVMDRFDYTVFDTPPTTQLLTLGSLIAGREAYIPMQAHFLAMEGMIEIIELVEQVQRHHNPSIAVCGIIPTFLDESAPASGQLLRDLRARLGDNLILKPIHLNHALAEAPGAGQTIFQHSLRSAGAIDYYRVALQIRDAPAHGR